MEKGQILSKIEGKRKRVQKNRAPTEKNRKIAESESTEGVFAPLSVPSIPIGVGSDQYDVFLSFRGSDTRKGFTDHLYRGLINGGTVPISVFRDDTSLEIGEDFDLEILNVITRSKISILVISENYASSKWCLRELVRIMDCKKNMSHIVMPIFYKVDPYDVRYLKGNFGEAFRLREKCFDEKDIQEWKQALTEVSYLNGWESKKFANGHEGELVEKVIKTILSELRQQILLDVPKHLVGFDEHVNKIRNWVDTPTSHARMIGIYGMGGIGKTTLAKVIYNELSNEFVHCSFLPDIRETALCNGIPYLQNLLINEIQPGELQVRKVDEGISVIKSRFRRKKVLILLDDIDNQDQLNALARERDWFKTGSIIIVTTRYKAVLDQSAFEVDYKYELKELDPSHSMILFKRHAFPMGHCSKDFEPISHDILSTMGGLPLAIKVISSYLYGETNRNVWQEVLEKLRNQPDGDVKKILRISYDALETTHQEIFLDIACFFIGKESKFAIYMWKDSGFYPSEGIRELKMRCLIKVGNDDKLMMHNQLRDVGRNIVRSEGPPERRSRLWVYEEAYRVLMEEEGTARIQAISLDKYNDSLQTYTNEQFKNLRRLRFLQMKRSALRGDFKGLFSNLRWFQWLGIEPNLSFLATNLHMPNLVVLRLSHNLITEHWRGWTIMVAERLKVLDLAFCDYLTCTPDLLPFINLEILILTNCSRLKQVHPSIAEVKSLLFLDLRNCYHMKELPEEVGELRKLKELILDNTGIAKIPMSIGLLERLENLSASDCSSLREIPNSIERLSSLQHLNLQGCKSLREIPSSIRSLSSLQHLNLHGCELLSEIPSSIGNLYSLQHLDLRRCQLSEIPNSIGDLQNLLHLDISESLIEKLPSVIGKLKNLRRLSLKLCRSLEGEIPSEFGHLSSLEILEITRAQISNLPKSIQNLSSLQHLSLWGCAKLRSLPEFPFALKNLTISCQSPKLPQLSRLVYLEVLDLSRCRLLEYIPELPSGLSKLHVASCPQLILPKLDRFTNLERLSIENCKSIERLDLSHLNRLKQLHVGHCYKLVEIHARDNLKFLEEIVVDRCRSIERLILPELQSLNHLKAIYCDNLVQIQGLDEADFLEALHIFDCWSIERLPDLSCFATLRELNIVRCKSLEKLPNLSKFEKLENFTMTYSLGVIEIPGIEELKSITHIDITGCKSMATLADLSRCDELRSLVVRDCKKLSQLRGLDKLNLSYLDISGCAFSETIPELPKTHIVRNYEKER